MTSTYSTQQSRYQGTYVHTVLCFQPLTKPGAQPLSACQLTIIKNSNQANVIQGGEKTKKEAEAKKAARNEAAQDATAAEAKEARETVDPFCIVINKAIGLADVIIAPPIFIIATIGLWKMRFYGVMTSFMCFGIGFYWTAIAWIKQIFLIQAGVKCEPFDVGTHGMLGFVFLFSFSTIQTLLKFNFFAFFSFL